MPVVVEIVESFFCFLYFSESTDETHISRQVWRVEEGMSDVSLFFQLALDSDLTRINLRFDLLNVV